MPIAWFITGYKLKTTKQPNDTRYCAMDDFTTQIIDQDGGYWAESEVLGGYAVVKVRASDATLTAIANTAGFQRLPAFATLDTTMGALTTNQRSAILAKVQAMGYTLAEIQAALGSNLTGWRTHTLGDLLRFIAQRRLKPRWDDVQKQIVLDGILQACRPIAEVDTAVQ